MSKQKHFDLNLLRIFVAVYQHSSITKAAEALDLTQSSVSNAIKRLQQNTGGKPLFIRSHGGITPSAIASNLYMQLETSMLNIDNAISSLDDFDPTRHNKTFVICSFDSIIQQFIGLTEQLTHGLAVNISYQEIPNTQDQIHELLIKDQIDLTIDVKPSQSFNFSHQRIVTDKLICVAANKHPRIKDRLSYDAFLAEKHVLLSFQRDNKNALDLFLNKPLPARKILSEQSSMMSMFASVAQTDAIAVSLERYAKQYAEQFNLKVLELPFETQPIDYYLIWNKKFDHYSAHKWLRELLVKCIQ